MTASTMALVIFRQHNVLKCFTPLRSQHLFDFHVCKLSLSSRERVWIVWLYIMHYLIRILVSLDVRVCFLSFNYLHTPTNTYTHTHTLSWDTPLALTLSNTVQQLAVNSPHACCLTFCPFFLQSSFSLFCFLACALVSGAGFKLA